MPEITATDRMGQIRRFDAPSGVSLMEALRDSAGMDIAAICGGSCSCATCHIYIDPRFADLLPAQQPEEAELLEFSPGYRPESSRLACQIRLSADLAGLAVELAPEG